MADFKADARCVQFNKKDMCIKNISLEKHRPGSKEFFKNDNEHVISK
jgi:hypothetical protein